MNHLNQIAQAEFSILDPQRILASEWYGVYPGNERMGLGSKMAVAYSVEMVLAEQLLKKYAGVGYCERTGINNDFFQKEWFGVFQKNSPVGLCMFEAHARELNEQFSLAYKKIKIRAYKIKIN